MNEGLVVYNKPTGRCVTHHLDAQSQSGTMCAFTSPLALRCVSCLRLIPMCPQRCWASEHHLLSLCMLGEPLSTTSGAFTSTICLHLLPSGWRCNNNMFFSFGFRVSIQYLCNKKTQTPLWRGAERLCQTWRFEALPLKKQTNLKTPETSDSTTPRPLISYDHHLDSGP